MRRKAMMGALRPDGRARGIKAILGLRPSPRRGNRVPPDPRRQGSDRDTISGTTAIRRETLPKTAYTPSR